MHRTASVLVLAAAAACSAKATKADTAAAAAPSASATAPDTAHKMDSAGMANMPGMGGMSNMTGDPDHDFLRMMSDHHKGLVAMAHPTIESKENLSVKPLATRLDKEQDAELNKMMTMLEKEYKDPYAPKVTPDNAAMVDDLKSKHGVDYDRTFMQHVIMHHQAAIKMIDEYLPKAKNATLKTMAEAMKATQTKEIEELKKKLS